MAALIESSSRDGFRVVVTGAPDERERAIVDAMLAALPQSCRTSVHDRHREADAARALRADDARAAVRRRRFGADAHRRGRGHACRRAVRPVRRARMGPVGRRAPRRRFDRLPVPALRQRRLRRRQGLGVPDDAAGRSRAALRSTRCSRKRRTVGVMRLADHPSALHAVRRRRALRRERARGAARAQRRDHAVHARMAGDAAQADRAAHRRSVPPRQPVARLRLRARRVPRESARAKLDLVQSHERLLCCDVYRAGDGVHAVWLEERMKGAPWWKRLSVRAQSVAPLRACDRAQAVREPAAAGGDLQLGDGARRDQRALRRSRREAAPDPQRRRLAGVQPGAAREWRKATRAKLRHRGRRDRATCSSAPASSAKAWRPRSRRWPSCRRRRISSSSAATSISSAIARSRERLGVEGRVHARPGRRPIRSPTSVRPTCSCCRRSTIRSRMPRSRRWRAGCR